MVEFSKNFVANFEIFDLSDLNYFSCHISAWCKK